MINVIIGFAVVGAAVLIGFIVGKINLLGEHSAYVLSRLVFFVLSPALLFSIISQADASVLLSDLLLVSGLVATLVTVAQWLLSRYVLKRDIGTAVITAASTGQLNVNNIGIPLSLYVLGDAAYPVPIILAQILIWTPILLTVLDAATGGAKTPLSRIFGGFKNPIVIASATGFAVAMLELPLPAVVMDPVALVGAAAIPIILINYGISLAQRKLVGPSPYRKDIIIAASLKILAMPLLAWVIAAWVFNLDPHQILVIVVLASLPSAQNVFNYAQRYDVAVDIARDVVFLSTVACVPTILLVKALWEFL